jgi:hypothetical protein
MEQSKFREFGKFALLDTMSAREITMLLHRNNNYDQFTQNKYVYYVTCNNEIM